LIQCTHRESDVLVLLAHGLSNKAIALDLGMSPHTVRDHVCRIMQRQGLSNRVELAIRAREDLWQVGDDARQYRLAERPSVVTTSEDKWSGHNFHLTEHTPPTFVARHL